MSSRGALHDAYYLVAHFEWLLVISLASLVLLALALAVRRRSDSRLAQALRRLSLASWALGLLLNLGGMAAWQVVDVEELIRTPSRIDLLNDVASVAFFAMLLAVAFCAAMIVSAFLHPVLRSDR